MLRYQICKLCMLVQTGALCMVSVLSQLKHLLIWAAGGTAIFVGLRLIHVGLHPLLWAVCYLALTLCAGIALVLMVVGDDVPIC